MCVRERALFRTVHNKRERERERERERALLETINKGAARASPAHELGIRDKEVT